MKKWLFSIFCWLMAITFFAYIIIAINIFDEDLLFYTLILTSAITPAMLFAIIGFIDMPRKEGKDEKKDT